MMNLPSAIKVRFSSSVNITAVPLAAFLGWTEIRDETAAPAVIFLLFLDEPILSLLDGQVVIEVWWKDDDV